MHVNKEGLTEHTKLHYSRLKFNQQSLKFRQQFRCY